MCLFYLRYLVADQRIYTYKLIFAVYLVSEAKPSHIVSSFNEGQEARANDKACTDDVTLDDASNVVTDVEATGKYLGN